jgi:two-component system, response regulator / RNA-binding antiterminator
LKVLLADDDRERAGAVAQVLTTDPSLTVLRLQPGEFLADAVAALAPDIVLVDMARPDRDALDSIRHVAARNPRPIVLFVDQDDPAFMEEAIGAGVSSYNVVGVPPPDVKPILRAAAALFRRHHAAQQGLRQAETRLEERAAIDRAKAILIRQRRITEPDAYRWLRSHAMAGGRRIADVAREIVRKNEGDAG